MGKFTVLISFLGTLIWKVTKNQETELDNKFFVTKDFVLNIDLQEKFSSGNDLKFTITTDPKAKQESITKKITDNITQDLKKNNVTYLKTIYPYTIGVTHSKPDEGVVFTMKFNEEKKQYEDLGEFPVKLQGFTELEIYSLEIVSIQQKYYLDCQFCKTLDNGELGCNDVLIHGSIADVASSKVWNQAVKELYLNKPKRRALSQKSISAYSDILFRDISTPDSKTITLTVQGMNTTELETKDSGLVKFITIRTYGDKQILTNMIVYGEDLIIGLRNKVERVNLDDSLNVKAKVEIGLKISTGLSLRVNSHLDLLSTTGEDVVDVIRWDELDSPLLLVPMNFTQLEGKKTNILGIMNSYQFTIFRTENSLIVRRFTDEDDYTRIALPELKDNFFNSNFNPDNTLIYTVKKDEETFNFNVLNFSLTSVATVVVEQDTTVTLTAVEQSGISKNKEYSKVFKIVVIPPKSEIYNKGNEKTEKLYLSERLTSEYLFIKTLPSNWFVGNTLDYQAQCIDKKTSKSIRNKIYSVEKLGPKKMNLRSFDKSANNIFYYEFYSKPLSDGTFSLAIQIELTIYLQKCIVSSDNNLKCRTWFKIEEAQMILEGILIKDSYFVYKITDGYKIYEFQDGALLANYSVPELPNERSTCTYQVLQKQDFLFCEDYEHRKFYVFSLTGGFSKVLKMDDIYANQVKVSTRHQNYVFLNSDNVIQVISIRTKQLVATIKSEITQQLDNKFKICGDILLTLSIALNKYEEWNIMDINNIQKIKEVDFNNYGYQLQKNTKLGYHFGCSKELPLVVHDGEKVKALIVRLGEIEENSFKTVFEIGNVNYYANYFVEALDLRDQERPRLIWSHLDTSNQELNVYGGEVSVFENNQLVLDLRLIENEKNEETSQLDCNLRVTPHDPTKAITIQFSLEVQHFPISIVVNKSLTGDKGNVTDLNKTFKIDMFKSSQFVDLTQYFDGEVLNFNINTTENDYMRSIKRYSLVNNYQALSQIMRCSRQETVVKDIYIARSGSIYALTQQAMFKIKNGTTYSVQNFMSLSSSGRDGFDCRRILLNEARNIIISLCEKASIPYLVVSNWNSMKPSNALSTQVVFNDIDLIQFAYIRDFAVYLFGKRNGASGPQTTTVFVKYELTQLQDQIGIDLVKQIQFEVVDYLELTEMVIYTDAKTKQKNSYFIGIAGDLSTVSEARILVFEENGKSLNTVFNNSFNFLLSSKGEEFPPTFSKIANIKCMIDGSKIPEGSKLKFICVTIQTRNYHYEFTFLLSNEGKFTVELTAGYIAYGDFTSPGPLTIHPDYVILATSEPKWKPQDQKDGRTINLPNSYSLIYKRNSSSFSNKIVNGIPMPFMDSSETILNLVTLRGRDFLILSGSNYYSMVAIELKFNNSLEIFKDITTKNLTIGAVNHFNYAEVHLKLEDDTLKYFLFIIGGILGVILVGFVLMFCLKKKEDRSKSTFDGFDAMRFADITDLVNDDFLTVEEDPEKMIRNSEQRMQKKKSELLERVYDAELEDGEEEKKEAKGDADDGLMF